MVEARMAAMEMQEEDEGGPCDDGGEGWEMPMVPIGGSGSGGQFAWDAEKKKIGRGHVMVGRQLLTPDTTQEGLQDGVWWIKVTLGTNSASSELYSSSLEGNYPANTDTVTYLPLYEIEDGEVKQDLRGCFTVQCWE